MQGAQPKAYPSTAFVLSLIGGIFIILGGIVSAVIAAVFTSLTFGLIPGASAILIALSVVGLIFGLIVLYGAIMLRSHPESAKTWGVIILVMSLLSWIGGWGGLFIGFLLGLIGGILAIVWHPPPMAQAAWTPTATPPMAAPGAAPASGQKFCASCGSPNAAGAPTCVKCGAPLPP